MQNKKYCKTNHNEVKEPIFEENDGANERAAVIAAGYFLAFFALYLPKKPEGANSSMKPGRFLALFATSSLTMVNVFLLVMLAWSVNPTKAQQFDSTGVSAQDLTSASAAVIQGRAFLYHFPRTI